MSVRIAGTGMCVPSKRVTNHELSAFMDTSDEWIYSRTGIKSRYVRTSETLTGMSERAALQALQNAGMKASDVDMVICATIGGDYRTPSLACTVSGELGIICPAFDVNAACAGLLYALDVASLYIAGKRAANVLVICAEMMSANADWTDRGTCVLFGDGAGACVVTAGNSLRYMRINAEPNTGILYMPHGTGNSPFVTQPEKDGFVNMSGQEVFKFAVRAVQREISMAREALSLAPEDIDYYVLHQANKRIIDSARARLDLSEDKFPSNIDRYANTSAAATLLLIHEMIEDGRIKSGSTLLLCAFGAGMTTGTCVLDWE